MNDYEPEFSGRSSTLARSPTQGGGNPLFGYTVRHAVAVYYPTMKPTDVIILAGGAGTRLWPASRKSSPKQFMDPGTGTSLIESTLHRAGAVSPDARIVVVTHRDHAPALLETCAALDRSLRERIVIISEPSARNTAAAIASAVVYLSRSGRPEGLSLVLPADHIVTPTASFLADVASGAGHAEAGSIVTFGVKPTRAETGYGYIEAGAPVGPNFTVAAFREKPDPATAALYLSRGGYLWNAGMFLFRNDVFLSELTLHAPTVATPLTGRSAADGAVAAFTFTERTEHGVLLAEMHGAAAAVYEALPSISIDYAVMEHAGDVTVVPASFSWTDVGSWDEIAALHAGSAAIHPENRLVEPTRGVCIEAHGNVVVSDLPVALCGVDDLIIVVKDGAVLVCKKGKSQLVKDAVEALRAAGADDVL